MPVPVPSPVHAAPLAYPPCAATAVQPQPSLAGVDRERRAQRSAALQRANEVRSARAAVKREVQEGALSVVEVLRRCPEGAETLPVGELLSAQHRWGDARTLRVLRRIPIPETKAISRLTTRQRLALIEALTR